MKGSKRKKPIQSSDPRMAPLGVTVSVWFKDDVNHQVPGLEIVALDDDMIWFKDPDGDVGHPLSRVWELEVEHGWAVQDDDRLPEVGVIVDRPLVDDEPVVDVFRQLAFDRGLLWVTKHGRIYGLPLHRLREIHRLKDVLAELGNVLV